MFQEAPGFERRLADLQAQIDRLTVSLQLWRDGQERLTPADVRLTRFADDVADVLQEWSAIGERHAHAVEVLERQVAAFSSLEERLHRDSADRFLTLQRMVQQEWAALRHLQLEPDGTRRDQAAELTHACVEAAGARATRTATEDRSDVERELQAQLARVVVQPPSVEEVSGYSEPPDAAPAPPARTISPEYFSDAEVDTLRTDMMGRLAEMRVLLRDSDIRAAEQSDAHHRTIVRLASVMVLVLAVLVLGGAWWVSGLQRELRTMTTRVEDVESQATRSVADAQGQLAAMRAESARFEEAARKAAAESQATRAILAAPDLIRYGLSGVDGSPASAQLLWSRTRGLILSAANLIVPPEGLAYQAWLLTDADAISAGMLTVEPDGSGTLVSDRVPAARRAVAGVSITLEPADGSPTPSGRIIALNRVPRPSAAP